MTEHVRQLLHALAVSGVRLSVVDGKLKMRAPTGTLTPDVVSVVKASEAEITKEIAWIQGVNR